MKSATTLDKILSLTAAVLFLLIFLAGCAPQETIKSHRDDSYWCLENSVTRDTTPSVVNHAVKFAVS